MRVYNGEGIFEKLRGLVWGNMIRYPVIRIVQMKKGLQKPWPFHFSMIGVNDNRNVIVINQTISSNRLDGCHNCAKGVTNRGSQQSENNDN